MYDPQSVPKHKLAVDPLKPPRHSLAVVKAYFVNPGSGKLNQALYHNDYKEWLALRESAEAYGVVGKNINHHVPAPKVALVAPPVEEPVYSLAECHEIGKGNITKFAQEKPIEYLIYQRSLAALGRGVFRPVDPETETKVQNLSNQLRAEKQAATKAAKLSDLAEKKANLDREIAEVVGRKAVDAPKIRWNEAKTSEERIKAIEQNLAEFLKASPENSDAEKGDK